MKNIFKKITDKFKTVYCEDCKHCERSVGVSCNKQNCYASHHVLETVPNSSKKYISREEDKSKTIGYYETCEKVRKGFSFCFKYEPKERGEEC